MQSNNPGGGKPQPFKPLPIGFLLDETFSMEARFMAVTIRNLNRVGERITAKRLMKVMKVGETRYKKAFWELSVAGILMIRPVPRSHRSWRVIL